MANSKTLSRYVLLNSTIASEIARIVGRDNIVQERVDLYAYARDLTPYLALPDMVVFPLNTQNVIDILKLVSKRGVPVTPRGGGASFQGSSLPVRGGLILDLSRMNKILEISTDDMLAVVQPGVRYETFDRELEKHGLAFPHDVGSHDAASIGGILASDSNGHHAYKYGRVGPWVQGLEVVLPDGKAIRIGGRPPRSNMGYNLSALFAGAEGTLGVITEATLRVVPRPKVEVTVGAFFDDLDQLMAASHAITMAGVDAGTLEATDGYTVKTISDIMDLGFPNCEGNFVGDIQAFSEEDLERRISVMTQILKEHDGKHIVVARDAATTKKLWAPRMEIDIAVVKAHPGYREFGFAMADPCVPLSRQAEAMREIGEIIRSHGLIAAVFCHTGIGIIHPAVLMNPEDADHWKFLKHAEREIFHYVQSIDGVLTAEHGLGYVKNPYVREAIGNRTLELNREIKQLFDPTGYLNPGKMALDTESRDDDVAAQYSTYFPDNNLTE